MPSTRLPLRLLPRALALALLLLPLLRHPPLLLHLRPLFLPLLPPSHLRQALRRQAPLVLARLIVRRGRARSLVLCLLLV